MGNSKKLYGCNQNNQWICFLFGWKLNRNDIMFHLIFLYIESSTVNTIPLYIIFQVFWYLHPTSVKLDSSILQQWGHLIGKPELQVWPMKHWEHDPESRTCCKFDQEKKPREHIPGSRTPVFLLTWRELEYYVYAVTHVTLDLCFLLVKLVTRVRLRPCFWAFYSSIMILLHSRHVHRRFIGQTCVTLHVFLSNVLGEILVYSVGGDLVSDQYR